MAVTADERVLAGAAGPLPGEARSVAVAPQSDGRLQLWVSMSTGQLFTTWKQTPDPDSRWAPWTDFLLEPWPLPGAADGLAAAQLSDGRLQLWVSTTDGQLFTTWKQTPEPDSAWQPWTDFLAVAGPLPGGARDVAARQLPGGRLQLWASSGTGQLFTAVKASDDPDAGWEAWSDFLTPPSRQLDFSCQYQQQTNWCWSAVATSVSHYYNPYSDWTQCALANAELDQATCCDDGSADQCNKPWHLELALQRTGNYAKMTGPATLPEVEGQIDTGAPFGCRIAWRGGGSHVVVLRGYQEDSPASWLLVEDPWYGPSEVTYGTFRSAYQGDGTWTNSYYTKKTG